MSKVVNDRRHLNSTDVCTCPSSASAAQLMCVCVFDACVVGVAYVSRAVATNTVAIHISGGCHAFIHAMALGKDRYFHGSWVWHDVTSDIEPGQSHLDMCGVYTLLINGKKPIIMYFTLIWHKNLQGPPSNTSAFRTIQQGIPINPLYQQDHSTECCLSHSLVNE